VNKFEKKNTYYTASESETEKLGVIIGNKLRLGDVAALYGDLGVGKTVFTRGSARGMGIKAPITSPTFTIANEYDGKIPLIHCDMYRISSSDELFTLGWEEFLMRAAVVVEWSENIEDALPDSTIKIILSRTSDTGRKIEMIGESADI